MMIPCTGTLIYASYMLRCAPPIGRKKNCRMLISARSRMEMKENSEIGEEKKKKNNWKSVIRENK